MRVIIFILGVSVIFSLIGYQMDLQRGGGSGEALAVALLVGAMWCVWLTGRAIRARR